MRPEGDRPPYAGVGLLSSSTSKYSFWLYSLTTDSTKSRTASTDGPSHMQRAVAWSGVSA
jgi:hypothetical protein